MKGLEMMLANMLGIKPEEMRAQIEQALGLMKSGAEAATQVQADLRQIKAHLGISEKEGNVNGGTAIANRGSSSNNHRIEL